MITWLVLGAWDLATIAVWLGPFVWVVSRWEREDRPLMLAAFERGEGWRGRDGRTRALRWAIGLALLLGFGLVSWTMHEASPALEAGLRSAAPF